MSKVWTLRYLAESSRFINAREMVRVGAWVIGTRTNLKATSKWSELCQIMHGSLD